MSSKHTPGPWKVINPGHGHPTEYKCVQIGRDKRYTTLEVLPADARLIAAAPYLLEAAKEALRKLVICRDDLAVAGNGGAGDDEEICEEAKYLTPAIKSLTKAIAKAEGKP